MSVKFVVSLILFSLTATAFQAQANYDEKSCAEFLGAAPSLKYEYEQMAKQDIYAKMLESGHSVKAIEFSALQDIMSGLSLKLKFKNGKTLFVPTNVDPKQMKEVGRSLSRSPLVEVSYTPESLARVGGVLKSTCEALQLSGCEVYMKFSGFLDPTPRPLSVAQEQVVKAAVFPNLPPVRINWMYQQIAGMRGHNEAIGFLSDMGKKNLLVAVKNISDVFAEREGVIVFDKVVAPIIFDSWQAALARLSGARLH